VCTVVSSPLILAYNLSDTAAHDLVWDIITNKEAIQVNQMWHGSPGHQALWGLGENSAIEVWTKPLGHGRLAAVLLNTANSGDINATVSVSVPLSKFNITGTVGVRDVWAKRDLADATGSFTTEIGHHACAFVVFVPKGAQWPEPFELAAWMKTKPTAG
jgi:alpha-galactosidase